MASAIFYRQYAGEEDLPHIMALVQSELSEPYVIYTFRYFLHQCHLAYPAADASVPVGVIVCKQSMHKMNNRGYIAMLSVDKQFRKRGIASTLVRNSISAMKKDGVEEVVLETEYDNTAALSLYESLGFIREKRLYRFYLNGKDAFRLVHIVPAGRGKGGGMNLPSGGAGMAIPGSRSDDSSDTASDSSYEADRARGRRIGYPYRAIRVSEPYDSEDEVSYR
ncbi:acyl-CoA N-acyltransferase [Schizophyllum commune Loenen D]|nr:acyl-CoA N-acyltransferase [Schizophyllum commune Loenen D]